LWEKEDFSFLVGTKLLKRKRKKQKAQTERLAMEIPKQTQQLNEQCKKDFIPSTIFGFVLSF